ncbi:flavin-containing monooxygenase [Geodermatophilus sp. SYSU D01176]
MREDIHPVVVVGAGPTGLAVAAELGLRGVAVVVLERGDAAGAAWRSRYRALRLNSGRAFSALPGLRFPPETPVFPTRDQFVAYLDAYAARHGIAVRTGVHVRRIDRDPAGWRLDTDIGPVTAAQVVVATGLLAEPRLPAALAGAPAGLPVVHSARYVDATPYAGRDVLVVGAGSSGMEIAHDLVSGGARRVLLSVRTPPNVLPRAVAGRPGDLAVHLLERLPPRLADPQARLVRRLTIGDLAPWGLPVPATGPFARLREPGDAGPAVVDRGVVDDVRAGRIAVVPALSGADGDGGLRLADGSTVRVDAVVAATGLTSGLTPLAGHLGVLDAAGLPTATDDRAALPGLRFVNFGMTPGLLRAAGVRARRTAAAVAGEASSRTTATPVSP